jgi:glyoxylase-like metal-dependent hydrolase (beta-lactamase superfamily II)
MAVVIKDDDIQIEKLELAPFGTNAYIVVCLQTKASLLVDAPGEADTILDRLQGTNPKYILLTHNHRDHVGVLDELRSKLGVPLVAHTSDSGGLSSPPEMLMGDGDTILLGNLKFEVLHTPGHTPGSLCFKVGRYLLSGDTIFPGGPGRTGSPDAFRQIVKSITEKIFILPDDTPVYPGHGDSTVLKKEKDEFAVFSSRPRDPEFHGEVAWLSS